MTMLDIVFSMNIVGGDVVAQGVLRLAPPTRRSDERPPVMYGHFCLVPRVSVHDRYYCTRLPGMPLCHPTIGRPPILIISDDYHHRLSEG